MSRARCSDDPPLPGDRVRRIETAGASTARLHPSWLAVPKDRVTGGAASNPRGKFFRNGTVVGALSDITQIPRDRLPCGSVPDVRSGKGVRDFVQQNLVDFVIVEPARQIAGHRDSVRAVVAQASAGLRVIEPE